MGNVSLYYMINYLLNWLHFELDRCYKPKIGFIPKLIVKIFSCIKFNFSSPRTISYSFVKICVTAISSYHLVSYHFADGYVSAGFLCFVAALQSTIFRKCLERASSRFYYPPLVNSSWISSPLIGRNFQQRYVPFLSLTFRGKSISKY